MGAGTQANSKVALADAWKLLQQAKAGDTEARKSIRAAKQSARAIVDEEDAPCMELWEDVEIPVEDCCISSQDGQNVIDTSILSRAAVVVLSPRSVFESSSMILASSKIKKGLGIQTRNATVATNQTEIIACVGYPDEPEMDAHQ